MKISNVTDVGFDDGSAVILFGDDPEGDRIGFAADHRMAAHIIEVLKEGPGLTAHIETWQILWRGPMAISMEVMYQQVGAFQKEVDGLRMGYLDEVCPDCGGDFDDHIITADPLGHAHATCKEIR